MLISIFAAIGSQNIGDELILKNEIQILQRKYGETTRFIVFSYDPYKPFFTQDNIEYVKYFPCGIKNKGGWYGNIKAFFSFLKIVRKSDLIVIGGGGILYDNEIQDNKSPLDLWVFRTRIFRFFRKKISFFRLSIDIKNTENNEKIRKIFSKAENISLRDEESYHYLKELGISSHMKHDPVFYDAGGLCEKSFLIKDFQSHNFSFQNLHGIDFQGKTIGIALRKGYFSKHNQNIAEKMEEGKINEILSYILSSGGSVMLLAHSFHRTDKKANDFLFLKKFYQGSIANKYQGKVRITDSLEETYNVYTQKKIDMCIAQRLHAMILSNVYGIPFFALSYSLKTQGIIRSLKKMESGLE